MNICINKYKASSFNRIFDYPDEEKGKRKRGVRKQPKVWCRVYEDNTVCNFLLIHFFKS